MGSNILRAVSDLPPTFERDTLGRDLQDASEEFGRLNPGAITDDEYQLLLRVQRALGAIIKEVESSR